MVATKEDHREAEIIARGITIIIVKMNFKISAEDIKLINILRLFDKKIFSNLI